MYKELFNRYYLLLFLIMTLPSYLFAQSNLADQQFLDNSDQFSDQHGVRLRSVNNASQSLGTYDSGLAPLSVRDEKDNKEALVTGNKQKKVGFSFSDMAKLSKKKRVAKSVDEQASIKKKTTFTFSNMASMLQKEPTRNIKQ
tara:strand:- start:781 stop:1206 length:426 start_codon:yes stop_codon:yes gene_type:complete